MISASRSAVKTMHPLLAFFLPEFCSVTPSRKPLLQCFLQHGSVQQNVCATCKKVIRPGRVASITQNPSIRHPRGFYRAAVHVLPNRISAAKISSLVIRLQDYTPGISVFSLGLYVEFHTKSIFDMELNK